MPKFVDYRNKYRFARPLR